eukprot:scaffold71050_cov22-Tisochrysis_lutea.AAC.2
MHPMLRGCKVEAKGLVQPTLLVLGLLCFQCHWTTQQMWVSPALQVATGLAAAGHADAPFWAAMEAASERRLLSFSGHHLAQLMVALGGFVLCGVALGGFKLSQGLGWGGGGCWVTGKLCYLNNQLCIARLMVAIDGSRGIWK